MNTSILLSREDFKESVFKRDGNRCVMCKEPAIDCHHIYDRKLFDNGGYYLDNGASLCSECHIKAENGDYTVQEIKEACNIDKLILPEGLIEGVDYDKWGKELEYGGKYGRTYHFNFSPGTTSDDRISYNHWEHISKIKRFMLSEKLDGENSCLTEQGVFARSHAAPTTSRWTQDLRQRWQVLRHDLKGGVQVFLENLYGIHSIEYKNIDHHYYVFAVRENGRCMCWEEVKMWAEAFDFPTVPVLEILEPAKITAEDLKIKIINFASVQSPFNSFDHIIKDGIVYNDTPCTREGVVGVNMDEYLVKNFDKNCFKYVKKGHVKTDEFWAKHWKRARLNHEIKK